MNGTPSGFVRRHAAHLVALGLVGTLYGAARLPSLDERERHDLVGRFRFEGVPLASIADEGAPRSVRAVHPSLEHISAWISTVGAGIALADLDRDGLANDFCLVDPRTDEVRVAPLPDRSGRAPRFDGTVLRPQPLPYDRESMAPMGCLPADLDEDGRQDLLVYYWGRTPVAFLAQPAASPVALEFRPVELVQGGERWYTNAASVADLDGDGHLDVLVGNYFPDGARILGAGAPGDAPQEMQDSMSRAFNGGHDHLLLCRPADASVACAEARGALDDRVSRGWTLAMATADLDGDQRPEVYLANDFGPDRLLHNRSQPGSLRLALVEGTRTLTSPSSKVLGRDSHKGMGVDFGDVDADGVLDIYVSNIAAPYALEESHFLFVGTGDRSALANGKAPFEDRSEPLGLSRSGWAWDARLADFDNDGRPEAVQALGFTKGRTNRWPELHELAMGNDTLLRRAASWPRFQPGDALSPDRSPAFFARDGRGRFFDIAPELGLAEEDGTGRGIAIADADGDGDLDFAIANQWGPSRFYRNVQAGNGAYLALRLVLPAGAAPSEATRLVPGHAPLDRATRPAIGAQARVHLPAGGALVAQVDGGSGHSGKRSPDLHFGLGDLARDRAVRVELRWRDREGRLAEETHWLKPGWHTVLLGRGREQEG
jgi:enediyne biosynthesis protein E4